ANLRKNWLDFSTSSKEILSTINDEDFKFIEKAVNSESSFVANCALNILIDAKPQIALPLYLRYLSNLTSEEQASKAPQFNNLLLKLNPKPALDLVNWTEKNIQLLHPDIIKVLAEYDLISELQCTILGQQDKMPTAAALSIA